MLQGFSVTHITEYKYKYQYYSKCNTSYTKGTNLLLETRARLSTTNEHYVTAELIHIVLCCLRHDEIFVLRVQIILLFLLISKDRAELRETQCFIVCWWCEADGTTKEKTAIAKSLILSDEMCERLFNASRCVSECKSQH